MNRTPSAGRNHHADRDGPVWSLAVHGGAGDLRGEALGAERERAILAALAEVLAAASGILAAGGKSLDAVEEAVRRLEDAPLFNAGKGAVLNARGEHELDASIMDGSTCAAGAAAGLRRVRNPVMLARCIMERSPHVFLQGEGAEEFASAHGIELVDPAYFRTEASLRALERVRAESRDRAGERRSPAEPETVGAVALDIHGHLAAATSTGGITNKLPGRVSDSAIIGAGTYASDESCAVSCTGQGEYFIRATAARDVAASLEHGGESLRAAAEAVLSARVAKLGGRGGLIAVDRQGAVACPFTTDTMYRGCLTSAAGPLVAIYKTE
ncbi:MAG TPA: isoaspartyl peptidase/L-asparaginase [Gammaproteobacteria bacterium]|nr:isoaspartyl peptidase/L-asparaginase [Gammaproteobacteria bacterium]